ncbi:phosphatidylglycerophosphate phosphatase PTPMT2-like [Salvia hispanica]|uniref:phosphatidylglycerophosphate phosphatase PTPMT2-like n=1 Tax=Salvia hispanica TaxID=49212 RepID=UPI002009CCF0|nr:phosphatidylglycerophosphate phosphatase PTPMT2-like [Salvia hispanica]
MKIEELDDGAESIIESKHIRYSETRLIAVRVDAKRALVGAGARILFYPTLLYNVFRNKIQAEFRWWDQIDQYLLLGAVPFPKDVPRLKHLGVGGVITLNEPYETLVPTSLYYANGIDHLVIPTRDYLFAPSVGDINRAVDFIHRNALSGQTTYVHCKAGRGRSTTIVLCYLVRYKQMTPTAALEYVRSRRPRVLLAPIQWKAVLEYQQQCMASKTVCTSGDAVLITKADLEGYSSPCNDNSGKELAVVCRRPNTSPMMAKLSCLFASLRVSGNYGPVMRQLTEARAC